MDSADQMPCLSLARQPLFGVSADPAAIRDPKTRFRCLRKEMLRSFAISLLLVSTGAAGQELAYLDLTGVTPRTTLRYPAAPPPICNNGSCTASGGSIGMAVGCGA